jgi:hypothetical protein
MFVCAALVEHVAQLICKAQRKEDKYFYYISKLRRTGPQEILVKFEVNKLSTGLNMIAWLPKNKGL